MARHECTVISLAKRSVRHIIVVLTHVTTASLILELLSLLVQFDQEVPISVELLSALLQPLLINVLNGSRLFEEIVKVLRYLEQLVTEVVPLGLAVDEHVLHMIELVLSLLMALSLMLDSVLELLHLVHTAGCLILDVLLVYIVHLYQLALTFSDDVPL